MTWLTSGNPNGRGGYPSYSLSSLKKYPQLIRHHVPISTNHRPVICDILRRKIQHFPQGVIVGERRLVLRDLSELAVQPFDDIGCIYDFPNLSRICKKRRENIPVFFPASYAAGIRFCPFVLEFDQPVHRLIFIDRSVNLLQVRHHFFQVLPIHIFGGRTDLVNNASLDL